jgi:uncharacterized lipoprotein YajG
VKETYSAILLLGLAAAACAAGPSTYWQKTGANSADFASDNESCAAVASRVKPTPRADQHASSVVAPNNRMDQPPRPWVSAVAEHAYMECMAERGWQVAGR